MRPRFILAALILCTAPLARATDPFPKEAELLKDAKVADGFELNIFSAPPQSNYPVFVSATPDGTLYVTSDGNGAQDRNANRGRILRLRDTDGDGRADEVKEFVKNVDSPRGLVVDGNTVYCIHPPNLSAFIDKDGDGVADEEKILIKNIGWTFKDRAADHAINGIELGIDGWLYIACGDFGVFGAEGADGRKLQLRGGGIVRVRPDGSDMQLFARGTRNILEGAVSPLLDVFARDNNNDGGGWEIRLHHFTGFEDHGYPRLFMNFPGEFIQPLVEYKGGSGMGAVWIDEPGWPAAWNNLPYTGDWGRGAAYRQVVKPKGATFTAEENPAELVKMSRFNDLDIDARGYVYAASWRGAIFKYAGPDVGYIVRIAAKGMVPAKVPDFAKATDAELAKLLESPSNRTRLAAQRTLLSRGPIKDAVLPLLAALAENAPAPLASRIAALYALRQGAGPKISEFLVKLSADPTIAAWAVRALAEDSDPHNTFSHQPAFTALKSADPRTRKEGVIALARFSGLTGIWADSDPLEFARKNEKDVAVSAAAIAPLLGDSDPIVAHTATQVLRELQATPVLFAVVDDAKSAPSARTAALLALRGIRQAAAVDGLIARLASKDSVVRQGAITGLCRLHFVDGPWKGDSWGTRPDTRGPYYQPEEWAETKKIADALKATLAQAGPEDAALLGKEIARNRIKLGDAGAKFFALAEKDPSLVPTVVKQLAEADIIPAAGLRVLLKVALDPASKGDVLLPAVLALSKTDGADSARAAVSALSRLAGEGAAKAREAFFNSRLAENQHQVLESLAEKAAGPESQCADAILLKLAARRIGAPEPREAAAKSLEAGWAQPKRRAQIIRAAVEGNDKSFAPQIVAALNDPDRAVASAATEAVRRLKIDPARAAKVATPAGPLIGTLKVEDVLAQVTTARGEASRGEQLLTQQGCVACHTVKASDAPKGPFLGNIAATYKRRELAEAVLLPSKSIAQGFITNTFTMKDGSVQMGFVTLEASDKLVIRNVAAQEITIDPRNVVKREKSDKSLMPEGLVAGLTVPDFASLMAYLEALAKK